MRMTSTVLKICRLACGALLGLAAFGAALAVPVQQLTVGLYPWVPRMDQFQTALQAEWSKVQPQVQLNFLSDAQWDGGYDFDPPAQADVYVFDAMYFDHFLQQNWLEPLQASEVAHLDDFMPYAREGVKVGELYYAIPQLGCASLLFYDRSDTQMANAATLSQLKGVLNQCSYTSQIPPDRRGLMVDMSGGTTDAALYLDTAHSLTGQYPFPLPMSEAEMNQAAVDNLRKILSIGSVRNAAQPSFAQPYQFAHWFSNGWGRAYVGYSESMSQLSEQARRRVAFKIMPFSDNVNSRPAFYADVIAVNPTVHQRGTRELAVQLANVMASTATMMQSLGPQGGLPPQYLMPTRHSIMSQLSRDYPLYRRMQSLIDTSDPIMFKLDPRSRDWLTAMKDTIKASVLSNPVCGCDYPALQPIANNSAAASICTATCTPHGGWNGQWTNQFPAAQDGSVCGCNSCAAVLEEASALRAPAVNGKK
jgi:thiamine pyridinylase